MKKLSVVAVVTLASAGALAACAPFGGADEAPAGAAGAAGDAGSRSVSLALHDGGCTPGGLAIPPGNTTFHITNQGGAGEFDIVDLAGTSLFKVPQVQAGQTIDLPVSLKTGHYIVDCRTDDTPISLTVGVPSTTAPDLGSVPAQARAAAKGYAAADGNSFATRNLVANTGAYGADQVDPSLADAWGLALRPKGSGGHFWIGSSGTGESLEYVGDARGVPLHQNDLRSVSVPGAVDTTPGHPKGTSVMGSPTGIIFNPTHGFTVDQGALKGPAKFIFATTDGTVSAWTEKPGSDGKVSLPYATKVIDSSASGAAYFGVAITPDGKRLLAADFGTEPGIDVFDTSWKPVAASGAWKNPFTAGAPKVGDLIPWNVTTVGSTVYISYAAFSGKVAEEDHAPGAGRVVAYDTTGKLLRILDDQGSLDAPWGVVRAPKSFGPLAGSVLVANFGDGTIAALDPNSGKFLDYLRGADNRILVVPGIWAMAAGNGETLGSKDALYFTAGPNAEKDGVFGRLVATRK